MSRTFRGADSSRLAVFSVLLDSMSLPGYGWTSGAQQTARVSIAAGPLQTKHRSVGLANVVAPLRRETVETWARPEGLTVGWCKGLGSRGSGLHPIFSSALPTLLGAATRAPARVLGWFWRRLGLYHGDL